MNLLAINVTLAATWAALTGSFTLTNLFLGHVIGFAALWLAAPLFTDPEGYFLRTFRVIRLIVFFLYELVVSAAQVVWEILTPGQKSTPMIVAMPLEAQSEFAILLTCNLISLTPGTLSLDVTPDRRRLFVHSMFADDPVAVVAGLKRFERFVREAVE